MQEILTNPQCSNCGHQVDRVCVAGAGCPNCGRRLWPSSSSSAPAAAGPAPSDFAALQVELDRLASDNRTLAAENDRLRKALEDDGGDEGDGDEGDTAKPKGRSRKAKGGSDGG